MDWQRTSGLKLGLGKMTLLNKITGAAAGELRQFPIRMAAARKPLGQITESRILLPFRNRAWSFGEA